MKRILIIILIGILFLSQLSGCASVQTVGNSMIGAAWGAVAGGIIGGPRGAIIGGLAGAAAAYSLTEYHDKLIRSRQETYNRRIKRHQINIENSLVKPSYVSQNGSFLSEIQYSVLSPSYRERPEITETRYFIRGSKKYELPDKNVIKKQGTYLSTAKIRLPNGIDKGNWTLVTVISSKHTEDRVEDSVYVR